MRVTAEFILFMLYVEASKTCFRTQSTLMKITALQYFFLLLLFLLHILLYDLNGGKGKSWNRHNYFSEMKAALRVVKKVHHGTSKLDSQRS